MQLWEELSSSGVVTSCDYKANRRFEVTRNLQAASLHVLPENIRSANYLFLCKSLILNNVSRKGATVRCMLFLGGGGWVGGC
jgi:hypothetical protein